MKIGTILLFGAAAAGGVYLWRSGKLTALLPGGAGDAMPPPRGAGAGAKRSRAGCEAAGGMWERVTRRRVRGKLSSGFRCALPSSPTSSPTDNTAPIAPTGDAVSNPSGNNYPGGVFDPGSNPWPESSAGELPWIDVVEGE